MILHMLIAMVAGWLQQHQQPIRWLYWVNVPCIV